VIEVDISDAFTSVQFAETTADGVTHVDVSPALLSGYRYYYRVKSVDDEEAESGWSLTQSFLTIMPPQDLAVAVTGEDVTLNWTAQPHNLRTALVYTVYAVEDPYLEFPGSWQVAAVQLTEPTWTDPGAAAGDTRKFHRVTVGSAASAVVGSAASAVVGSAVSAVVGSAASAVVGSAASAVVGSAASAVVGSSTSAVVGSSASAIVGSAASAVVGSSASAIVGSAATAAAGTGSSRAMNHNDFAR